MKRSHVLVLRVLALESPKRGSWSGQAIASRIKDREGVDFPPRTASEILVFLRRKNFIGEPEEAYTVDYERVLALARRSCLKPDTGDLWVEIISGLEKRAESQVKLSGSQKALHLLYESFGLVKRGK